MLKLLDLKRIRVIEHKKEYHAKLKRAFGKKIKPNEFKVGHLVLKGNVNNIARNDEVKEKIEPNLLDPFVVVEAIGSGAYKLSSMDGK